MSKRVVLLQALAATPPDLRLMLGKVDGAAASHSPAPSQWSIRQLLEHLLDVEVRYLARLQRVVNEDKPFLPAIHPNAAAAPITPCPLLLVQFEAARAQTVTFLQDLPPGSWQRPALHETLGATKLRFLVQMLVDHDTEHLSQLIEIQQLIRRGMSPIAF